MSLKTWRAEFYPVPASRVSKRDAAAHSLRKWLGARPAALRRHGFQSLSKLMDAAIGSASGGEFSARDCALCHRFQLEQCEERCAKCPLAVVRNGIPCFDRMSGESVSPYCSVRAHADPEPMIRWLRKAVRYSERTFKLAATAPTKGS